jgi:hypothetical protein
MESGSRLGLYPRLLGPAWDRLDQSVRSAHAEGTTLQATGVLRVRHGPGRLTRLLLRAVHLPPPAEAVEVRLLVNRRGSVERWQRRFGAASLVTVQREGPDRLLIERLGVLEFRFRLAVVGGALVYRSVRLAVWLGPFRLPLPRRISPRILAREGPADGPDQTGLTVEAITPAGDLLFSYEGNIHWARGAG